MTKCPFLLVHDSELEKVKPEFRDFVKADAEKCVEGECPSFFSGQCTAIKSPIHHVTINGDVFGPSYYPETHMLVSDQKSPAPNTNNEEESVVRLIGV